MHLGVFLNHVINHRTGTSLIPISTSNEKKQDSTTANIISTPSSSLTECFFARNNLKAAPRVSGDPPTPQPTTHDAPRVCVQPQTIKI